MATTYNASNADNYEQFMGRWSRQLARPFLEFAGVADGERVLEVGCGTGSLTLAIAETTKVASIDAIDLAEIYVAAARAKTSDPRVHFHIADASSLPFANNSFDRALSQLVLHFVPDAPRAIAEMARVVRPGGVVAASVWDSYGGVGSHRIFWDAAAFVDPGSEAARANHFARPMTAEGEMEAAWKAAGLREVVQSSITIRKRYANFEDYWSPIRAGEAGLGKHFKTLTPATGAKVEETVRLAYLSGRPDGPRSFPAVAWVCRGVVA